MERGVMWVRVQISWEPEKERVLSSMSFSEWTFRFSALPLAKR